MYGQIPVSEYNGVPNINIPLYTIDMQQFQLPISLSYHASGIRVSDEASWVGMNWSLNAGGVITRSKRNLDDFSNNGYFKTTGYRPCNDSYDQEPDLFFFNIGTANRKIHY
jgi:hypothetical protein